MLAQASGSIDIQSVTYPENHLVTARSHLIDRFNGECEIILLPPRNAPGGRLEFARKFHTTGAHSTGRRDLLRLRKAKSPEKLSNTVFFDFRLKNPHNWAHFLNNHLPICFALLDKTGLGMSDVTLVLPENIPGYILKAADLFGLATLATNGAVTGDAITFTSEPWTGIRPLRNTWVELPFVQNRLQDLGVHGGSSDDFPRKVFLSRQDTRILENEAELEKHLVQRGYVKVYPEKLSPLDQLRLFEHAESMVAVHGAGLAPLLYLSENASLKTLVELFPCGHMTDVFRNMAHQKGCKWIGVRGKIKPEHVVPAYDLDAPFLKFSLQSFEVDLASVDLAFDLVDRA